MTWRPTPTVAALGRVVSGGTSICRSVLACAMQASRQPDLSSSGLKARTSRREMGTEPSMMRTLHFLHVPCPPQVESTAMPFQLAASKTVTPGGTRNSLSAGWNRRCTRPAASCAASAASTLTASGTLSPSRR